MYFSGVLAPLSPGAGRFSLLFLYSRIFKSDRSFYVAVRIVGVLNGLWYIGCTVALCLRCVPVKKSWDPLIEGQCFDATAFVVGTQIPDCLLDFAVMILPISVLRKLQMSLRRKIQLTMVFALGGL